MKYLKHSNFSDKHILKYLSFLFSFMFSYSIVQEKNYVYLYSSNKKNKGSNLNNRDYYRAIALSNIISTDLQQIIINRISNYIYV